MTTTKKIDVELRNIRKSFGDNTVVEDFNLQIEQGECISFLGPSGCGKTTTLNMIAGFLDPNQGEILIKGKLMNGIPSNKRDLGMVFQTYSLFPHMTVEGNVEYGLKLRKVPSKQIKEKVDKILQVVKLPHLSDRFPKQLSGGQRQRIAIARALVTEPSVLLLDEPLSNLDAKLREELREELKRLQQVIGVTTIFVTHDQEEAMYLSDRIVVLDHGKVEQIGTPWEIYNKPASEFVHVFIGKSNRIPGVVKSSNSDVIELVTESGSKLQARQRNLNFHADQAVSIYVRPEKIQLVIASESGSRTSDADINSMLAVVRYTSFLGSFTECIVEVGGNLMNVRLQSSDSGLNMETGTIVKLSWKMEDVYVFPVKEN